jgi:prevent-host-death family protein
MTLRAKLGEILDAASAGERIVVERDRKPLAILVPFEDADKLVADEQERIARNLAAIDRLEALRKRTAKTGLHYPDVPDAVTVIRRERSRDDR